MAWPPGSGRWAARRSPTTGTWPLSRLWQPDTAAIRSRFRCRPRDAAGTLRPVGHLRGLRADLRGRRRRFTAVGRCAAPALSASVEATLETGQGWPDDHAERGGTTPRRATGRTPERTLHDKEQTAMADQEILAGPKETAEDSGTLGLIVYGDVGGNMQTVLSYTATGPEGLAWLTGNFTGTENMGIQIAQPWDNNGTLGLNIYGDVGGTLQPVFTSSDMGQGSGALAWLTGNFTGTGNDFTEIAQLWDDNGALGLIIYGSPGGNPQAVFAQPDMGQSSGALAFLAGNFTGAATTEIAQLWDNNGVLGLIVYGISGGTLQTLVTYPDMGQG